MPDRVSNRLTNSKRKDVPHETKHNPAAGTLFRTHPSCVQRSVALWAQILSVLLQPNHRAVHIARFHQDLQACKHSKHMYYC